MVNSKVVIVLFIYMFLVNSLIHVTAVSVLKGSYEDIDLMGTIGSGEVVVFGDSEKSIIPNYDYIEEGYSDDEIIRLQQAITKQDIVTIGTSIMGLGWSIYNLFTGRLFNAYGTEGWIGYFEHFIGSIFRVFDFVTGLISFRVLNVVEANMDIDIPDIVMVIFYMAYFIPMFILMVWILPYVITFLVMVAHWINSVLPFT